MPYSTWTAQSQHTLFTADVIHAYQIDSDRWYLNGAGGIAPDWGPIPVPANRRVDLASSFSFCYDSQPLPWQYSTAYFDPSLQALFSPDPTPLSGPQAKEESIIAAYVLPPLLVVLTVSGIVIAKLWLNKRKLEEAEFKASLNTTPTPSPTH